MPRILLTFLLWLAAAPVAVAHATLLHMAPPADAELAAPPGEVVLRFNEPVTPVAFRLLDAAGRAVADEPAVRGSSVILPLPPLGDGTYIVSWRVVSTDAHPIGGAFRFAVGTALAPADAPVAGAAGWTAASALHRAGYLALLFLAAGGAVFLAAFHRLPALDGLRRRTRYLLVAAALLGLGLVPVQGGRILAAPPGEAAVGDLLAAGFSSPIARGGLGSAGLLILAASLIARRPRLAAAMCLGAVATLGLSGHAATADPRWLAAPTVALHAALAALWAGALLPLRASLPRLPAPEAVALLRAFSRRAVPGVATLVLAGAVLTVVQVGRPAGFLTAYGAVLALKLLGVALLLAIAAWNRARLTSSLAQGRPGALRRLRLSIALEIAVMLTVVACVAALGHLTPPRALALAEQHRHQHTGAHHHPIPLRVEAGGRRMDARIARLPGGGHRIAATFTDPAGTPLDALGVEVSLSLPERGIEPIFREMTRHGDSYAVHTHDLTLPGTWQLEFVVLVSPFERTRFRAEATIH